MKEFSLLRRTLPQAARKCIVRMSLKVELMAAIFMVIDILINNRTPRSIQFNKFVPVMWTIESVMRDSIHQSHIRVIRHEISRNIAPGVIFRCHRTCHICSFTGSSVKTDSKSNAVCANCRLYGDMLFKLSASPFISHVKT